MSETTVKPADLLRADDWQFEYRQKSNPQTSNLDLLTYGTYRVGPNIRSDELYHRKEETILFSIEGVVEVTVEDQSFTLNHYDTLYLPLGTPYRIREAKGERALLVVCRAPAENEHPIHHAKWEEIKNDESRIRNLEKKQVFLMFDVSEGADKLVAGYTIFEPHARSWPPHNHTDQEEVYVFTQGNGAMEVYADEQTKSYVHSMNTMDASTIPLLNYHPVFSQDEELHFIWCLSGERYWVGDKNKDFMDGKVDKLTT